MRLRKETHDARLIPLMTEFDECLAEVERLTGIFNRTSDEYILEKTIFELKATEFRLKRISALIRNTKSEKTFKKEIS